MAATAAVKIVQLAVLYRIRLKLNQLISPQLCKELGKQLYPWLFLGGLGVLGG